jgi:DNA invertase Pin-like site-specific DNA recombinase
MSPDAIDNLVLYISYIRFSSLAQAAGDSLRRQIQAAKDWCARNGATLDPTRTFRDLGRGAFLGEHRKNPDRNALAAFLKLVEEGEIPRGSYLLIENLDRLTREDEVPACHLLTGILMAGIRVVQLAPYEMLLTEKSNGWELMRAVMELSRGHGESVVKSDRLGKVWAQRKANARKPAGEGRELLTLRLPAWVRQNARGGLVLVGAKAKAIVRVFELAADGYGQGRLVGRLQKEKVPPVAGERWVRSYLGRLLHDRRVLGELQPKDRKGSPDGEVIVDYFPRVVSEELWDLARGSIDRRGKFRGRVGKEVNVFAGLVLDPQGASYNLATRVEGARRYRVLVTADAAQGRAPCTSFPFQTFEAGLLACLAEIKPADILPPGNGAREKVQKLAAEETRITRQLDKLALAMEGDEDLDTLRKAARSLEGQLKDVRAALALAKREAACPLAEGWGRALSLLEALKAAPDPADARTRLRGLLRGLVDEVRLLVVPQGRDRLAVVQLFFRGGGVRHYLLYHRAARGNARARTPAGWRCFSFAAPGLDLRRPILPATLTHWQRWMMGMADFEVTTADSETSAVRVLDPRVNNRLLQLLDGTIPPDDSEGE